MIKVADYVASLEKDAEDLQLYIEGPVDVKQNCHKSKPKQLPTVSEQLDQMLKLWPTNGVTLMKTLKILLMQNLVIWCKLKP